MNDLATIIINNLKNLIVVSNPEGLITYVGPSAKEIIGYNPEELLGDSWWKLTRDSEEERRSAKRYIKLLSTGKIAGEHLSYERLLNTADGEEKWIWWSTFPNPDGSVTALGYDITKRKLAEKELENKNKMLSEKNGDMLGSIQYAKRIQDALLPTENALMNSFADCFAIHWAKDVVSGDFYWHFRRDDKIFLAVVDCTGHGVPGAMMSVLGNSLLREVVVKKKLEDPAEILYELDKELRYALSNDGVHSETEDGMDLAFCVFHTRLREVKFAGAFRPLVQISGTDMVEYKANRNPIGYFNGFDKTFNTQTISYEAGDTFYMFSDGYADQFGGEYGKKFNSSRFRELLLFIQDMDMTEQRGFLEYAFNNWKQDNEQVDDIMILGVKV